MHKFIFIIVVFIVGFACSDSFEFTNVTLSYKQNTTIDEGAWIEIDGNKIVHVNSFMEMNSSTMPVSNMIVDKVEEKEWKSKVNYIGMGLNLARAVENLSDDELTYTVEKDFDLQVLGKVKIAKSDGRAIRIRFSDNYPVVISEGN